MKIALIILVTLITVSPSSNYIKGVKINSEPVNLQIGSDPDSTGATSRSNWTDDIPYNQNLKTDESNHIPTIYHIDNGLQFLPRCKPGDEKPEILPNVWKNLLKWIKSRDSD